MYRLEQTLLRNKLRRGDVVFILIASPFLGAAAALLSFGFIRVLEWLVVLFQ